MKKKPISILKREAISSKGKSANFKAATKKRKSSLSVGSAGAEEVYLARPAKRRLGPPTVGGVATKHAKWFCYSYVDRDAASILGKILTAKKAGLPISQIKALTLAPNIREKKATHAVVCKTLEHLPLIEKTATASGLLANPDLAKEVLCPLIIIPLQTVVLFPVGLVPFPFRTLPPTEDLSQLTPITWKNVVAEYPPSQRFTALSRSHVSSRRCIMGVLFQYHIASL